MEEKKFFFLKLTFELSCIPLIFVSIVVISKGLVPKSRHNGQQLWRQQQTDCVAGAKGDKFWMSQLTKPKCCLQLSLCTCWCAVQRKSFPRESWSSLCQCQQEETALFMSPLVPFSPPLSPCFPVYLCLRTAQEQTFTSSFLFVMLERHGCVKGDLTGEIRSRAGRNSVNVDKDVKDSDTVSLGPELIDMTSHHVTQWVCLQKSGHWIRNTLWEWPLLAC